MTDKYNGSSIHVNAILHMIGQLQSMAWDGVTVAEIAKFMNVSKPTARKYLRELEIRGLVKKYRFQYRGNSIIHKYMLGIESMRLYREGKMKWQYEMYVRQVLKIILL